MSEVLAKLEKMGGILNELPEPIQTMVDNSFVLVEEQSYIACNGRACKKNTSEKAVVFCKTAGDGYMGWGIAGLTATSVQATAQTANGDSQYLTYTLPSGTVIHYAQMASQWGGYGHNVTATVGGQTKSLSIVGFTPNILPICAYLLGVE